MQIEKILAEQIQATLNAEGLNVDLRDVQNGGPALQWTVNHTTQSATTHQIDFFPDQAIYSHDPERTETEGQLTAYEYANPQFPKNLTEDIIQAHRKATSKSSSPPPV